MEHILTTPTKLDNSKTSPTISVIIPLYNKAPYIKRAIDSILAQTVQNFEIVVVNDGSTDGSEKIVAEMNDSRIRLINQKNQGVSAARNNGVSVAHADLVAFLDADDEWLPEFLETILQLRATYPDAGMYTTGRIISRIQNNKIVFDSSKLYGVPDNWTGIISSVFKCAAISGSFPATSSSVSIPKTVYIDVGGFQVNEWTGEDWDLWGRIALNYCNAHCSKNMVIIHRDGCCSVCGIYGKVSKMDYHPFQKSITELCIANDNLVHRIQNDMDLKLFLEKLELELATWKIFSRSSIEKKKGRIYLQKVHAKIFQRKKIILYIISYLPTGLASYLLSFININPVLRHIKNSL